MIEILISGEGNSDVGEKDRLTNQFIPGPVTILTDKILRFYHKRDICFQFKSRSELKRYPMTLKGKKKRFKNAAAGKGHSDLAYKLGCFARENRADLAVLMRDAGKDRFQTVYDDIRGGFEAARFENGVPAVPTPESEAWLIACLEPEESARIESCKADMKILLEEKLIQKKRDHSKAGWREVAQDCVIDKIKASSFQRYKNDLKHKTKYLY